MSDMSLAVWAFCLMPRAERERMNNPSKLRLLLTTTATACALAAPLHADTVLETETAELGKKGEITISNSIQFEHTPDGRTAFSLTQFEYAITDRAEILIEPFFQQWEHPKDGKSFHGMGDLEITPSYMIQLDDEKSWVPAIVLAFKLKVPTARNRDIGTGEYDYYPYVIVGKKIGNWIFNANLGINFFGQTPGEPYRKNQLIYDFSAEYKVTPKWSVFGEIFGNSKPSVDEKATFAGAAATEYQITEHFNVFVSVGYDTDRVFNVRPGFNFVF